MDTAESNRFFDLFKLVTFPDGCYLTPILSFIVIDNHITFLTIADFKHYVAKDDTELNLPVYEDFVESLSSRDRDIFLAFYEGTFQDKAPRHTIKERGVKDRYREIYQRYTDEIVYDNLINLFLYLLNTGHIELIKAMLKDKYIRDDDDLSYNVGTFAYIDDLDMAKFIVNNFSKTILLTTRNRRVLEYAISLMHDGINTSLINKIIEDGFYNLLSLFSSSEIMSIFDYREKHNYYLYIHGYTHIIDNKTLLLHYLMKV